MQKKSNDQTFIGAIVCFSHQLRMGEKIIFTLGKIEIGIFRLEEGLYALANKCPHQGAPLCLGKICGTTKGDGPNKIEFYNEGKILRCPWHGWEFDITSGKSLVEPDKILVKKFKVEERRLTQEDKDRFADPHNIFKTLSGHEKIIIVLHTTVDKDKATGNAQKLKS